MTTADYDTETRRTIPGLMGELLGDSKRLLRDEVDLAKAEVRETVAALTRNLVLLTAGAVVLIAGALVLASALNRGLTALFAQFMSLEVAVWLAPLVLALVLLAAGGLLVKKALDALRAQSLVPRRTVATLKEDKQWLSEKLT